MSSALSSVLSHLVLLQDLKGPHFSILLPPNLLSEVANLERVLVIHRTSSGTIPLRYRLVAWVKVWRNYRTAPSDRPRATPADTLGVLVFHSLFLP